MSDKRFLYCRDRLFLGVVGLYFLNRWVFKPLLFGHVAFFHSHLNDLICAPFWLPPLLCLYRQLGLRGHDRPPNIPEAFFHLLIWSFIFEVVTPSYGRHFGYPVADPWDVVCYFIGGALAVLFWNHCGSAKPGVEDGP